jgi:hypothetical protein
MVGATLLRLVRLVSLAALLPAIAAARPSVAVGAPAVQMPIETVDQQVYSGLVERRNYIIKDREAWQALWEAVYAFVMIRPPAPEIDFTRDMVIAVAVGEQPTGGYTVEIEQVVAVGDSLQVFINEGLPGRDLVVTDALTQPYHIVRLHRVDTAIPEFIVRRSDTW